MQQATKRLPHGIWDRYEFKNRYQDIANDVEAIVNKASITIFHAQIVEILSLLKEIPKLQKIDEQLNATNMPELEEEESAGERRNHQGQGLKILTPDQMLSRLSITLDQLKAGNNLQKLINEIRQLLYSLYRSKKPKQSTAI